MKRIFTHLLVAVLLMLSTASWAQFSDGKVYRIVCSGTTSVSLGATALKDVGAVATNETDKSQQWYVTVDDGNYTFRNLSNGYYLLGNNSTSEEWGLTKESNNFTVTTVSGNYCIRGASHSNGYGYMHKDNGNNIVSWETGAANSQWTPIEVAYTAEQLQTIWAEVEAFVVPDATVEGYKTALGAIFADEACTQLNSTYVAMSVGQIKADGNYNALPAVLQAMVLKVKGDDWAEANAIDGKEGWSNEYAKRFRVQMYEPYSIEGEITSYLRINAHCNMDNPTGIYANAKEAIYIMVGGDIADGAELWVAHQAGLGATNYYNNNAYFQLKKGLNVVPYFNDGSTLWINYVVHTYNANGTTVAEKFPHKISDYKPLKIHIEGGHINGYYNAIGDFRATDSNTENLWGEVDNDEDWNYYKERAPLNGTDAPNRDFPLLGHRQTLLFPLGQQANDGGGMEQGLLHHLDNIAVPSAPNCYSGSDHSFGDFGDTYYPGMGLSTNNGKINIMLEAWDRIMYSELATLGLVSKSTMDKMNALYPRWTGEGTPAEIYDYNNASAFDGKTYQEFCQGIDYSEYFNHHGCGVGAPSGYMSGGWRVCNYHYNTMGSIIGVIANESGPTWGPAHEIGHQHQSVFNLNGLTEVTNNFFSNVAVWYMGMGTSRVNGSEGSLESVLGAFNTDGNDLYTNNIWAITHLYYRLWLYYHLAGNNTQFWPRLFELCRREPITNGGQISGDTSLLRFYKHACNAAGEDLTEFFRAHGYFEVMDNRLVGDYSNATYNVTQEQIDAAIAEIKDKNYPVNYAVLLINDATSTTTPKHDGETSRSLWDGSATAEVGSVNDFVSGNIDVTTNYEASVAADGTVTMAGGQGGVGFLVLNEKGELVSFSNKTTFTLNEDAKYMLATGKGSVLVVNSESETTPAEVDLTDLQKGLLESFIADVDAMPIDDGTYTHIGFYTKASATELLAALESAKTILEAGNGGYAAAYEVLYSEKEKFLANSSNATLVPFDPSLTYVITNYAYGNTMHLDSGVKVSASADKSANTAKWQFKATSTDGAYNLYCLSGYYLPAVSKGNGISVVSDKSSAAKYTLQATGKVGAWEISTSETTTAGYGALHDNSYGVVVGWSNDAVASMWYLTAIEGSTNNQATPANDELQVLIAKTEALVNKVANVSWPGKVELQATDAASAFYITSNATEAGHEPRYLLDNDKNTFFHTVWTGTSPGADHYLQIDMGQDGVSIDQFVLKYTNLPTTSWNVDAAKSITVQGANILDQFTTIATLTSSDTNPLPTEKAGSYTSATLGTKGTNYRYLRLTVTNATGGKFDNRYYFGMAELALERINASVQIIDACSTYVQQPTATTAVEKLIEAKRVLESGADVQTVKTSLQEAYDALYAEYNSPINAKKDELQALIDATNLLVADAGTITHYPEEAVALSTSNLYCNATIAEGKLEYILDNDDTSFMHTQWSGTSADNDYHYLRVDMGEGVSIGEFYFTYTTASRAYQDMPKTIVVEGANEIDGDNSTKDEFTEIATLTAANDNLPQATNKNSVYESRVLGDASKPYRYLRFRVTQIGRGSDTGDIADDNGYPYFTLAKFGLTKVARTTVTINENYRGSSVTEELIVATMNEAVDAATLKDLTSSIELLDAQIVKLQGAKEELETAMNSFACNKDELIEFLVTANALYDEFTENDEIAPYYATSSVTAEQLAALKTAIEASNGVVDDDAVAQDDVDASLATLQEKAKVLQDVKALDYTGERTIGAEITTAETLLAEVMTAAETPETVVLQNDDATAPYYIWCNKPATDSNGIAGGLIDKNADGTAKTGTFFGTYWQAGVVDPYTHYLEIDLGCVKSIENFAFDYATRASGYENQRPNGIKVLVSNDKEVYKEVLMVTEGLATDANATWALDESFGFVGRYVRFAVSSQQGYFNMSDFNINFDAAYSLQDFYTTSEIDASLLTTLNSAVLQAVKARDCFVTEEGYDAAFAGLATAYSSLNDFKSDHVSDREPLSELATATNTVVTEVATITEGETAITMQCTDATAPYYLYCNADGTATNGDGDTAGVAALVGDNATNGTHLHTTYNNRAQADDLDHYLRLDMGKDKAMVSFKFSYTGRVNNVNNAPTKMVIEGSNDLVNFDKITNLDIEVPESGTATFASDVLGNGKAYRYIRFMVTDTKNHATNNGHPFFVLSQFAVTACKTIEVSEDYESPNLSLSTLVTANNEVLDANAVVEDDHYLTKTAYNAAIDKLQSAHDALVLAKNLKDIPVVLTTDANNPVLYKIKIKRSDVSILEYDQTSKMVAVADAVIGNKNQAWYFKQGTVDGRFDDILILPYWNEGAANTAYRLATNDLTDGKSKVKAVDGADASYKQNWYITTTTGTLDGWWNIKLEAEGETTYFSHHGGGANKMGFWSSDNAPGDNGSNFQFVLDDTDYSKSDAYFALYNLHATCGGTRVGGSAIGCYTQASVDEYNAVYNNATTKLAEVGVTDDEYNTLRETLETKYYGLTRNMPVEGGFYRIRSAGKDSNGTGLYCYNGLVYVTADNQMSWGTGYNGDLSNAIWYFEAADNGYYIKSLHTGGYAPAQADYTHATLTAEASAKYTIEVLNDENGILKLTSGKQMHAQQSGNKIVGYNVNVPLYSASAWVIEPVDEKASVMQTISLNTAAGEDKCYSTLYSAYPVELPAGIDASIVTAKADNGVLEMQLITNESNRVVPAYTAVILSQDKADATASASVTAEVNYSDSASPVALEEGENMLQGTLTTEYIACGVDCADWKVYTLGRKNNKVAMYWAYANYDESGNRVTFEGTTSHDKGGYVKIGANKAYLKIGGGDSASAISMFSFWFAGGTTGVDGVASGENMLDGVIYDLQGRKITEVTSPGIYIVNGKKVYIGDVE